MVKVETKMPWGTVFRCLGRMKDSPRTRMGRDAPDTRLARRDDAGLAGLRGSLTTWL